jgi:hypothetical protein
MLRQLPRLKLRLTTAMQSTPFMSCLAKLDYVVSTPIELPTSDKLRLVQHMKKLNSEDVGCYFSLPAPDQAENCLGRCNVDATGTTAYDHTLMQASF